MEVRRDPMHSRSSRSGAGRKVVHRCLKCYGRSRTPNTGYPRVLVPRGYTVWGPVGRILACAVHGNGRGLTL